MAKETKKDDKKKEKIVLERVYNVPLRRSYLKAPRWKRTNRAVRAIRAFVIRHMKASEVKIGKYLNLEMWKHGAKNPPHHIKVNCRKDEEGVVKVEILGAPEEKPKEPPKKKEKKEKEEVEIKVKDALSGKEEEIEKLEEKEKEITEEKAEKAKEIEKEEIKELKKEHPKAHHPPKQAMKERTVEAHPTAPRSR